MEVPAIGVLPSPLAQVDKDIKAPAVFRQTGPLPSLAVDGGDAGRPDTPLLLETDKPSQDAKAGDLFTGEDLLGILPRLFLLPPP